MNTHFLIRSAALAVGLSLLVGCATPLATSYQPVPPEMILLPSSAAADSTVGIRRDPGLLGAALKVMLSIDGRDVAKFGPGRTLTLPISAGEHKFSVRWAGDPEAISSVRLNTIRGQSTKLRITVVASPAVFVGKAQPVIMEM